MAVAWFHGEQREKPGCLGLGYIGDEMLPNHVGSIINHETGIPINQPVQWKVRFFSDWLCSPISLHQQSFGSERGVCVILVGWKDINGF